MLIQTAGKELWGVGKHSRFQKKNTANGCNNFPRLIKIKHFFPQLRGRGAGGGVADWQDGDRRRHSSESLPERPSMKTFLDSVVQRCRKWAVTATSPGLAQLVPVAFHAEKKPPSGPPPARFLGWLCLICHGCQHTSLGSGLKNKGLGMGTDSRSSCLVPSVKGGAGWEGVWGGGTCLFSVYQGWQWEPVRLLASSNPVRQPVWKGWTMSLPVLALPGVP